MKKILSFMIFILCLCLVVACDKETEKKSPSDSKVAENFIYAIFTKDASKVCELQYKEIVNKRFDGMDGCEKAATKVINHLEDETYGFKTYEQRGSKKEYTERRTEDVAIDLEEDYGVSLKNLKKVVKYKYKIYGRGTGNNEIVDVTVGKINGEWYVIDYDY